MENKVVMILVDGMRPDGLMQSGSEFALQFAETSLADFCARTVMPSVTLPCHMSLFHSVPPERHGVTTNIFTPMVRPVEGLFEQLDRYGKKCAFFNTWEELRDISLPDHISMQICINQHKYTNTDVMISEFALSYIRDEKPDFSFIYLGETDECGHAKGWMSPEYLERIHNAWDCIERICDGLPEDYTVIVLADHGGHDRAHGTDKPTDMTIPVMLNGPAFDPEMPVKGSAEGGHISILDVAPTIAALLGVPAPKDWEGVSLI
ncbi:MAG: alkaline phosphatase family protein [Clostridia bacterium]|nr:alkaline phosphatase family protein [Clostridia bacterium]